MFLELGTNTLDLVYDAAPWLLFGLLMAGLIKAWAPEEKMKRWLGGSGVKSTFGAALAGAPLPICSCGVLPVAVAMRRTGASREATVSFMISTPETGVDSVAVSYALLGPFMAVARPLAAVASAVFTGLLVALAPAEGQAGTSLPAPACDDCCSQPAVRQTPGPWARTRSGIVYAFTDILDDILVWLVIGLVVAGAVTTYLPPDFLNTWGSGPLAMAVMLVAGIPLYICATASTPLAAAFLIAGVSPGAVMVFMLAGPATNVATLAVVRREMGSAVAILYLAGICVSAVAAGLAIDAVVASLGIDIAAELAAADEFVPAWLAQASSVVLALLAARYFGTRMILVFTRKTA
jgi:hypothetical protein